MSVQAQEKQTHVSASDLLDSLSWRYATKKFDPGRKIPADVWETLERTLVLSPSSFGLQPWKFIVIQDRDVIDEIDKKCKQFCRYLMLCAIPRPWIKKTVPGNKKARLSLWQQVVGLRGAAGDAARCGA